MDKGPLFKAKLHDPKTASRKELVEQIQDIVKFLTLVAQDFEKRIRTVYDHEKLLIQLKSESSFQRDAWNKGQTSSWESHGKKCAKLAKKIKKDITRVMKSLEIEIQEDKLSLRLLTIGKASLEQLEQIEMEELELEEHEYSAFYSVAKQKLATREEYLKEELEKESVIMAVHDKLIELIRKQHPIIVRLQYFIKQEEDTLEKFSFKEGQKFDPVRREQLEKYLEQLIKQVNSLLIQEKKAFYDPFNELARQEVTPIDSLCEMMSEKRSEGTKIDMADVDSIFDTMTEPDEWQMLVSAIKSNPDAFTEDVVASAPYLWKKAKKDMKLVKLKATHDILMGVKNRHSFEQELKQMIKDKKPLSLVMIDIDHFKQFNDTYGHDIGDKVLKEVASVLKKVIRQSHDEIYRVGGEEIMVALPNTKIEGAEKAAEKMRISIEQHPMTNYDGEQIQQVTISLGVVALEDYNMADAMGLDAGQIKKKMIKQADNKLYEAKESGRNQVKSSIFTPTTE